MQKIFKSTCPVCNSDSEINYSFSKEFIREQLENYYDEKISDNLVICDYDLLRCTNCYLEFAWPLKPGNEEFYKWITSHINYYPDFRWEWSFVLEKLKERSSSSLSLLEVGCGSGLFLDSAKQIPNLRVVGLDTTLTSIEKCQERGLEAYDKTLEDFLTTLNLDLINNQFDFVVSFHCLEHISNPKELIKSMLLALKPEGSIFISTPYSPMSFENIWFDPLNHPPHHMTRWNAKAYQELAQQLGLKINLFMPQQGKAIDRTFVALNYAWNSPAHLMSWRRIQLEALKRPLVFFWEWLRQCKREKLNNQVAADVVLVELTHL